MQKYPREPRFPLEIMTGIETILNFDWREVIRDTNFLYRTIDRAKMFLNRGGFGELLNLLYRRKMLKICEFSNFQENSLFLVFAQLVIHF